MRHSTSCWKFCQLLSKKFQMLQLKRPFGLRCKHKTRLVNSPRSDLAFVVLILAFLAVKVGNAVAHRLALFHQAKRTMAAWRVVAHLNVLFTVLAGVSNSTNARILADFVDANAAVEAGRALAFINVDAAETTHPTRGAIAREVESTSFHALTPIMTFIAASCFPGVR